MRDLVFISHVPLDENSIQYEVLYENKVPENSPLRAIQNAKTPAEQAEVIIKNKIPYRLATSIVDQMTPSVLLALVNNMSDKELVNNLGSLKKRGAFENKDIKNLIEERLKKVTKVSALKASESSKFSGVSDEIKDSLDKITTKALKKVASIKRDTAIFIDKSLSMRGS